MELEGRLKKELKISKYAETAKIMLSLNQLKMSISKNSLIFNSTAGTRSTFKDISVVSIAKLRHFLSKIWDNKYKIYFTVFGYKIERCNLQPVDRSLRVENII